MVCSRHKVCGNSPHSSVKTHPERHSSFIPLNPRSLISFPKLPLIITMKFFNIFLTALFISLLGVAGSVAQTSDQVITAIQSFTTASSNLETQITGLNAINFPTMGFVRPLTFAMISSSKLLC